jgi:hypothetical protein
MTILCLLGRHRVCSASIRKTESGLGGSCKFCVRPLEKEMRELEGDRTAR